MNESELQSVNNCKIYPRGSKIDSDKGFVNIDNGSQGGSHWKSFIVKDQKSFYFDSFGGSQINFYLNNYLIQ